MRFPRLYLEAGIPMSVTKHRFRRVDAGVHSSLEDLASGYRTRTTGAKSYKLSQELRRELKED